MERMIATMVLSILMAVSGIMASAGNVATVREGRVWEYVYSEGGGRPTLPEFDGDYNMVMFQMWFDGTEDRNGKEYHRLVASDSISIWGYKYVRDSDEEIFQGVKTIPNRNKQTRLLREEDGKVYLYVDNTVNAFFEPGEYMDLLIYDFTKNIGGSYKTVYCLPYLNGGIDWYEHGIDGPDITMNIKSSEYVTIDGEECLSQVGKINEIYENDYSPIEWEYDYNMIEGIGLTGQGYLPFLMLDLRTASIYFEYKLNRVYNADGEVIYRGEDIDTTTLSIGSIAPDAGSLTFANGTVKAVGAGEVSLTLYDISGRSVATDNATESAEIVTEGLPHGVYIAVCKSQSGMKTFRIIL